MFCTMPINNKLYTIGYKKNKPLFNETAYPKYLYKKRSYMHHDTHTHTMTQKMIFLHKHARTHNDALECFLEHKILLRAKQ